ncbi:hypothetical protein C8F01DRAFT_1137628 [Mycena amicta]|nr:hypothetical protein C8F01DRAFT_1137628 [Mycena amicta]
MLSSAFTCRFGTNYAAEDAEVNDIQSILVEPTTRLASLDDEIAALQKTMDGLVNERSQLVLFIDNHKALLSPIRRMPRDVFEEIFVACMPVTRNCVMSSREAPLLLGRVCSAWRSICLSTPRLWARLHISQPVVIFANLPETNKFRIQCERGLATLRDATEMWLARSGQCSLSISVSCSSYGLSNDVFGPDKQSILNTLIPFASRWQHVTIFGVSAVDLKRLPKLTAADFPRLKSIQVTEAYHSIGQGDGDDNGVWHDLDLFNAEFLSSVDLTGSSFHLLSIPLRWASLLEIHIRHNGGQGMPEFSFDAALEVLRRCTALQTFRFSLSTTSDTTFFPPIEHVALRTLAVEIHGDVSTVLRHICRTFILPELRSISFHGSSSSDPDTDVTDIGYPTFLEASPKLEDAQVFLDMFTEATLPDFLRHLPPSVRRLCILPSSRFWMPSNLVDSEVLTLLTPSLDSDPSIPVVGSGIEELDIDRCEAFDDKQLLSFIKSRIEGGGDSPAHRYRKLKSLTVRFTRDMEDDIMPELQQYIEDGLLVNLVYPVVQNFQLYPWSGVNGELPTDLAPH